jgi:ABC-2 type transport system ATP-binding protein
MGCQQYWLQYHHHTPRGLRAAGKTRLTRMWISTNRLTKRYGSLTALDHCDLEIERGEIFGLLGPNGAGKTTLLRLLMGLIQPTSGSATVDGLNTYTQSVAVHRLSAYLPGDVRLFRRMRATEFLAFIHSLRSTGPATRGIEVARRLELDLDRKIAFMSTGMRQKLALSAVLASDTQLIVLDEPTSNLDPNVRSTVARLVKKLQQEGRTIIFSSHVMNEVEEVSDRVAILRQGQVVHMQAIKDLKRSHRIQARWSAGLPQVPAELKGTVQLTQLGEDRIRIDTTSELSRILGWLATLQLEEVRIEPIGLRSVYDQFHSARDGQAAHDSNSVEPHRS